MTNQIFAAEDTYTFSSNPQYLKSCLIKHANEADKHLIEKTSDFIVGELAGKIVMAHELLLLSNEAANEFEKYMKANPSQPAVSETSREAYYLSVLETILKCGFRDKGVE